MQWGSLGLGVWCDYTLPGSVAWSPDVPVALILPPYPPSTPRPRPVTILPDRRCCSAGWDRADQASVGKPVWPLHPLRSTQISQVLVRFCSEIRSCVLLLAVYTPYIAAVSDLSLQRGGYGVHVSVPIRV